MMMFNKKFKKYICISVGIVGTSFVGLKALAKYKKGSYIYQNSLKEQNPFEGKKVIFVNDENVKENADGVSGYLEEIGDSDFVPSFYDKYIKRTMDVVLSFGGLVVLSPVFAGVALAIMIEDPGPVFFTQKRVGQNKKYFTLHKFRSMKLSTPHDVPTHQLENPEQYITKIGKFIRAHSLDELPQIWDIFVGNMSVIGPRPALWNQDLLIAERDKYNANDVKPGLTGWAQINGRDELEIEEKARLDGEYVQKESLLFDTKCFIGTISKVGHDDSVVEGGTREMSEKKKWDFTTGKSKEELIGNIGFGEPVEVDRTQVKKVLITGAGSYIGEAFENYTRENYADNFQIDTVDMLDDIWRTKDFSKYDIVYHVAGIAHADVGNAVISHGWRIIYICALWFVFDVLPEIKVKSWMKNSFFLYCSHLMVLQCFQRVIDLILEKIGIAGGVLSIIEYIIVPWMIIGLLLVIAEFLKRYTPDIWKLFTGGRG